MHIPTEVEIYEKRTPAGGWTAKTLAEWGIPFPPPKGWKTRLIKKRKQLDHEIRLRRWKDEQKEKGHEAPDLI
jgi:hypothetical protein